MKGLEPDSPEIPGREGALFTVMGFFRFGLAARSRALRFLGLAARSRALRFLGVLAVAGLVASACSGEGTTSAGDKTGEAPAEPVTQTPQPEPTTPEERLARIRRVSGGACTPGRNAASYLSGNGFFCLPFDAIPAINDPTFVPASRAGFLPDVEPVVAIEIGGRARAYPVRILITHEIVNDTVAGKPVVVSFCPLCNSATAFSRRMEKRTLTFGVSGQLLSANLVMFDRETISLWQQVTGKAFNGEFRGKTLERLPVQMVGFGTWKEAHPNGKVMEEPVAGFDYGRDPYASYGRDIGSESRYFRPPPESGIDVRTDPRLKPKRRVIGVESDGRAVAFPVPRTRQQAAVAGTSLRRTPLVAFFRRDTTEPSTGQRLEEGRRGWSGAVYRAQLDGRDLSFRVEGKRFFEVSTGSLFNFFGEAVSGPMQGSRLKRVDQITAFWFSWADSYPNTDLSRAK